MPNGADWNSTCFSSNEWGAWSVAIASIVPSFNPLLSASTSAFVLNGGFIFVFVSKPLTASSVSEK